MIFAPVEEVRVYRNSAVVRRKAALALQAGTNEVILSGISPSADPDSLRLFFPAAAKVVGKDMQILPLSEAIPELPSRELDDEMDSLRSRIQMLKTMEDLWIANGNFTTRGECTNETIEGYLKALPAQIEELKKTTNALRKQLGQLEEKRAALTIRESFQAIRLVLDAAEAGETVCEMEYVEKAAQWNSTYEIHTTAESAEVNVVSRARIKQLSGEDWENVRISLYTGNPAARKDIPVLRNMYLRFRPELSLDKARSPFSKGVGAAAPMSPTIVLPQMRSESTTEMLTEGSEEIDADTMTGYSLPGRRIVKSGSTGTMADLKTETVASEKQIVCIPKLDATAYLAAVIKTADWPLKPSAAKIYLNENYCGETFIAPDLTDAEFMLSLGSDERIALSRQTVLNKTEDVLLKGLKRKLSEFRIRVTNNCDKPLRVVVFDQIPVSSEKQIVVDHVVTDGAESDEETGKLKWTLQINGKDTAEKHFSYQVTYPKDKTVDTIMPNRNTAF